VGAGEAIFFSFIYSNGLCERRKEERERKISYEQCMNNECVKETEAGGRPRAKQVIS
jgi:hypothetical protein